MKKLPKFRLPPDEHQARSRAHLEAGKAFVESVRNYDFSQLAEFYWSDSVSTLSFVIAGIDEKESTTLFGPVNTIENAGCVVYVSQAILNYYGVHISVLDLAALAAKKGYKSWYFKKYPKKHFSSPAVYVGEVKAAFRKELPEVDSCETVQDLKALLGELEGIGGSAFLIDNVITMLSSQNLIPVVNTRIFTVDQLLGNLSNGYVVPVRLKNSIYHDAPEETGGHYAILAGIIHQHAIVLDSSLGYNRVPIRRFLEAVIADEGLVSVWDTSKI